MTDTNQEANDALSQEGAKFYVLGPGQGVPGFGADVKASHASTGGALTAMESRTRGGAPMHVHSREDECFYVVEGTIIGRCGEDTFEAGPRSFVFLPRGIPHSWDVGGEGIATALIITVPGGFEEFMRDYHGATSQEDKDQVAARYGLTWVRDKG